MALDPSNSSNLEQLALKGLKGQRSWTAVIAQDATTRIKTMCFVQTKKDDQKNAKRKAANYLGYRPSEDSLNEPINHRTKQDNFYKFNYYTSAIENLRCILFSGVSVCEWVCESVRPENLWTPYFGNQWRDFHPFLVTDVFRFIDVLIGFWDQKAKDKGHSSRRHNRRRQHVEFHLVIHVFSFSCKLVYIKDRNMHCRKLFCVINKLKTYEVQCFSDSGS